MNDQHPAPGSYPPPADPASAPPASYPPPPFPPASYPPPALGSPPAFPPALGSPPAFSPAAYPPAGPGQGAYPPGPYSGAPAAYPPGPYSGAYPGDPAAAAPYGYFPGQPQPPAPVNGFAIAGLVCGVAGIQLLGFIFSGIALAQIRRTGGRGRGLAIGGLIASGAWVLIIAVVVVLLAAFGDSSPDGVAAAPAPGASRTAGAVDVEDLHTRDCVNGVSGTAEKVYDLPVVPCSGPHEGEVFATFALAGAGYPGDDKVSEQAYDGCDSRYDGYTSEDDPAIEILYLHPTRDSWSADRGVTCIAVDANGPRTGSLHD